MTPVPKFHENRLNDYKLIIKTTTQWNNSLFCIQRTFLPPTWQTRGIGKGKGRYAHRIEVYKRVFGDMFR